MSEMISEKENDKIQFDPNDFEGMCRLMDTYGKSDAMFFGKNEKGEEVTVSVLESEIAVKTFQKNGYTRLNTYYKDGGSDETYDGRWKAKSDIER